MNTYITGAVIKKLLITVKHDMTKTHFSSFLAYLASDRVQFVKFYPEGNAETRMQFRGRGYLYIYCNKHGLMRQKVSVKMKNASINVAFLFY